jgi:hypothetical protein
VADEQSMHAVNEVAPIVGKSCSHKNDAVFINDTLVVITGATLKRSIPTMYHEIILLDL